MGLVELDLDLGEEERGILDAVRKFASEVMRPIGARLDRMADPADVIAPASPLWEAYRRYRELFQAINAILQDHARRHP